MEENTIDMVDRISMLPECIVHHTMSYLLDYPKAIVRMSVLSKEWFALTASFPILNLINYKPTFSERRFANKLDDDYIRDNFFKYVAYTMSRFCEQNISAHTLNIRTNLLEPKEVKIVEDCVVSVLKKGVHMLKVFLMGYTDLKDLPKVRLPDTLLSASLLTSLDICNCEFPLSLMVDGVKLASLKLLTLVLVVIDEGVIEHLTAGSPLLREITLRHCHGLTTFNVCIHHNLQKVDIYYCESRLERIDINIEAPNLRYFSLMNIKKIAPSMNMASCQKLTTFCYRGPPLESFTNVLSSFPVIENFSLGLPSYCKNLKLSNHSLRRLELHSYCDLDDIDINTPNLLLFKCYDDLAFTPSLRDDSYPLKACMECHTQEYDDPLWFQKLRRFLNKNSTFKVLNLRIYWDFIYVAQLTQLPPYELEHVDLMNVDCEDEFLVRMTVDALLWCCRPRSLTFELTQFTRTDHVIKFIYEKLLQQEDEGQTNIQFVLTSFSEDKKHFSDLNSLLKVISLDQPRGIITFIKEKVVQEA